MKLELGTDDERAELVSICEAALVPQAHWHDRDSQSSQASLGECWALLRAGCDFHIHTADGDPASDEKTIWVTVWSEGFQYFELGERKDDLFYLPTRKRLKKAAGKDWY